MICKKLLAMLLLLYTVILLGCTSSSTQSAFIPMTEENKAVSTEAFIFAGQGGVYRDFKSTSNVSAITMGGAIPALIDASINNADQIGTEDKLDAIGKATKDINFGELFKTQITSEIKSIEWIKLTDTQLYPIKSPVKPVEILKMTKASNALIIKTSYNFTSDYEMIVVKTNLVLFPSAANLNDSSTGTASKDIDSHDNCLYKNSYLFKVNLNKKVGSKEEALAGWMETDGKLIRDSINKATREIPHLIKDSLKNPDKRTQTTIYKKVDHKNKEIVSS